MDKNVLVTVIIPVYNMVGFVDEAVKSVIQQTYKNLEIIIIDDGSTDGSGARCDEYEKIDSRIRIIHQENRGLGNARNKGLNEMTGDAVAFLDSDDALCPEYIESMMTIMIQEQVDLVLCRYTTHTTNGIMIRQATDTMMPLQKAGIYNREYMLNALAEGRINHNVWNKLYSRRLWEVVRFPNGSFYEDLDTVYRVMDLCNKVAVIDKALYLYRKRAGSIANTCSPKHINDWHLAIGHFESFVRNNIPEIYSDKQLRLLHQKHFSQMLGYYGMFSHRKENGWNYYNKQLRIDIIKMWSDYKPIDFRMLVCYLLLRFCPWFISPVYSMYVVARKALK